MRAAEGQNGVVFEAAPLDPREAHEFLDSPRHTASIVSGWVLAGLLGVGGLVALVGGAAPSDPCSPGASACGPEPLTAFRAGLVLLTLAAVSAIWSLAWRRRDGRYEFQVPPEWPPPPPGWRPPRGWSPPGSWPPPPTGWKYWR